jgi:hypothetical protein
MFPFLWPRYHSATYCCPQPLLWNGWYIDRCLSRDVAPPTRLQNRACAFRSTRLLSHAASVSRTPTALCLSRFTSMTLPMPQLQVVKASTPAWGFGHDVIDFDGVVLGAIPPPSPASSPLMFQESSHARAARGMPAESCTPLPPVSVLWAPRPFHLPMVLHGGLRVVGEGASSRGRLEAPSLTFVDPPGLPHAPVCGLLRRTAKGPGA